MAAGDVKIEYAASSAITITLASLAESTTFLVGRESTVWDNTSNKYLDLLLGGLITTGTSPTASKEIRIYAYASIEDNVYPQDFTGTDAAVTIAAVEERDSGLILAHVIPTNGTNDVKYNFGPLSIASLYGGVLPKKGGIFVTHNTGANLNSTGSNHDINITPIYSTVEQ